MSDYADTDWQTGETDWGYGDEDAALRALACLIVDHCPSLTQLLLAVSGEPNPIEGLN
jgi:hypothetical protein